MFKRPEMLLLKQGILSEPHWGPISCIVVQVNTALRPKKHVFLIFYAGWQMFRAKINSREKSVSH